MIPEAAVEEAAKEVYHTSGRNRVMPYSEARKACESEAKRILEAAAPHMLAEAWDVGCESALMHKRPTNPYRKAR